MGQATETMKILAAIASYGTNNDPYLQQLIDEYSKIPYQVDVVVVSNIRKKLPPNIEVVVGLPSKNPWSLPFAHKSIFADRLDRYDLFIYSEDDTLITQQHIEAFLDATDLLKPDEIAGFLRSEQGPDGTVYYSTIHSHHHWDPYSVCRRGNDTFAFFTNEHGACYILTQDQLRRSIASGGFSVPPHEGKYDMLVTAATDPYTQCGFRKMVCISRLEDFTCKHLTNKYIGRTGLEKEFVDIQVRALLDIAKNSKPISAPMRVETKLPGMRWTKSYYEPCRNDLLSMIPAGTTRILSLGCGWGKTEEALLERGVEVSAIPLDVVIGRVAEARGIRVIPEDLESGPERLRGEVFDVLLICGLLHLIDDPVRLLRRYGELLSSEGMVVVSCPNLAQVSARLRRLTGQSDHPPHDDYRRSGVHRASNQLIRRWLVSAGFSVEQVKATIRGRWCKYNQITLGLAKGLWAYEFAMSGRKAAEQGKHVHATIGGAHE